MEDTPRLGVTAVMLPEIDFDEQIALCASLEVRFYQLRPRVIPLDQRDKPPSCWGNHRFDLTPDRLLAEGSQLARKLREAGLVPWGTLPSATVAEGDEVLLHHLRGAAEAGAGRVRLTPPSPPAGIFDYRRFLEEVVERYRHVVERLARPLGVKIVFETHAQTVATSPGLAWNIASRFDPRDLGVIFDINNFAQEGEVSPTLAVSVLRDWIDCVHVGASRRMDGGRDAQGFRIVSHKSCGLQDGDLYLPAWLSALAAAGVDAPLIIEDFSADAPGPERLRGSAQVIRAAVGSITRG